MNETQEQPKRARRPHHYYKLSEKDDAVIAEALYKFVPVYVLAKKIGCGYHPLLDYIKRTPHLNQIGKDAEANMVAFAKGKLMQKVGSGHAASIMFLLERLDREHFGRYATIETIGDLPTINVGTFTEKDFVQPTDPSTVGDDAKSILANAAAMARRIADEEDAKAEAEAEAAAAGQETEEGE